MTRAFSDAAFRNTGSWWASLGGRALAVAQELRSDAAFSDAACSDAAFSDAAFSDAAFSDAVFSDAAFSDAAFSNAGSWWASLGG